MPLSKTELSLRGRVGAHALHARYDARDLTEAARAAFLAGFERKVDPTGELSPEERQRRARHLLQAHMAKLSLAASRARARRQAKGAS